MTWSPTNAFLHGYMIKSFLPLNKHNSLNNDNFQNLYPGDEVFIFETNNDRWARGYVISKPFPSDFSISFTNMDNLPKDNVMVVIFPLKYVKIVEEIEIKKNEDDDITRFYGDVLSTIEVSGQYDGSIVRSRPLAPPLPMNETETKEDVHVEIRDNLNMLSTQIIALYSVGEFTLFEKLTEIHNFLNDTRIKLINGVLTSYESQLAKETVMHLLNKIPKLLDSDKFRLAKAPKLPTNAFVDTSGHRAILARDTSSMELMSHVHDTPPSIAHNQVLSALEPNFPIGIRNEHRKYSLDPAPNRIMLRTPPYHVLVEFKSLQGSATYQPPGFTGMIVYLQLRNHLRRLTESFAIDLNSLNDPLQAERISAALFRHIPASAIEGNRVYLVAMVVEELELDIKDSSVPHLKKVKKGVAAGVGDVTKVFSSSFNSVSSDDLHQVTLKLYGSYMSKKKELGGGWGELVQKIISGSTLGVTRSSRAESLTISIKEFKHKFSKNYNPLSGSAPIANIKPIFFDSLAEDYERIYLTLGKLSLTGASNADDLLTIEVTTPHTESIAFSKASNQTPKSYWTVNSVFSDEVIGEVVKVSRLSTRNQSNKVTDDEYINVSLYINGVLSGEAKLVYKIGNKVIQYDADSKGIDIMSIRSNSPIAHLDFTTEYIGRLYNSIPSLEVIFQYDKLLPLGQKGIDEISSSLMTFCDLELSELVRYFTDLMKSLYQIAAVAINQPKSASSLVLQNNVFRAIVYLLDAVFGKQDQYLFMIDIFLLDHDKLPDVRVFLMDRFAEVFVRAENNWSSLSRSCCRVSGLLFRLALAGKVKNQDRELYLLTIKKLMDSITKFISIDSLTLVNDQVYIIDVLDYILSIDCDLGNEIIITAVINTIEAVGLRGLGLNDEKVNPKNELPKTRMLVIGKLLLIDRLMGTKIVEDSKCKLKFLSLAVLWAMEVIQAATDIEGARLAMRILMTVSRMIWHSAIEESSAEELGICFSLAKFLPALAKALIKYNKYTRTNGYFAPKSSFTFLFPTDYPFEEMVIDTFAGKEVLVELLVEISSVFCLVARIGKAISGKEGFRKILQVEVKNDFFDPKKYTSSNFQSEDMMTIVSSVSLMRQGKFFPDSKWLSLYSLIIEGCLTSMELIEPLLLEFYIPPLDDSEQFGRALWGSYFRTLLKLATLPPVAVEYLSPVPRKACYLITSSIRGRVATLLNETWDALGWPSTKEDEAAYNLKKFGGYQVEFINSDYAVLEDLMLFALQENEDAQTISVKILWSLIASEFVLRNSTIDIRSECLNGLHHIYSGESYKPGLDVKNRFIEKLKSVSACNKNEDTYEEVDEFINILDGFIDEYKSYNDIPPGAEFDADRAPRSLKIYGYLSSANKPELFHSYINSLYEEYLAKGDHVQAALTLTELASVYTWDHRTVLPQSIKPKFPEQTSFERKEALYRLIANNFVKGNSLEKAVDTYNELLESYYGRTYDLKSFSYVHSKLAKLYLDLESSERLWPTYFNVFYIGSGFPANIRGKVQIFEGLPFEHITSIYERLLKAYPGAQIITDNDEAHRLSLRIQTGRFLHVRLVEPNFKVTEKLFNTSIGVRQYARSKDLKVFTNLKKLPGSTSVYDLWTEETTYETEESFPTLMNRSTVKSISTVKLSPLDNAIRTVVKRSNDLAFSESAINTGIRDKTDYTSHVSDLARLLTGTVDAPINGGIGQYRGFFEENNVFGTSNHTHPEANKLTLLDNGFSDLATILSRCLQLYAKIISPQMRPAHEALVELFTKNFKREIKLLGLPTEFTYPASLAAPTNSPASTPVTSSLSQNNQLHGSAPLAKRSASMVSGISSSTTVNSNSSAQASSANTGAGSKIFRTASEQSSVSGNSGDNSTISSSSKSRRSMLGWRRRN